MRYSRVITALYEETMGNIQFYYSLAKEIIKNNQEILKVFRDGRHLKKKLYELNEKRNRGETIDESLYDNDLDGYKIVREELIINKNFKKVKDKFYNYVYYKIINIKVSINDKEYELPILCFVSLLSVTNRQAYYDAIDKIIIISLLFNVIKSISVLSHEIVHFLQDIFKELDITDSSLLPDDRLRYIKDAIEKSEEMSDEEYNFSRFLHNLNRDEEITATYIEELTTVKEYVERIEDGIKMEMEKGKTYKQILDAVMTDYTEKMLLHTKDFLFNYGKYQYLYDIFREKYPKDIEYLNKSEEKHKQFSKRLKININKVIRKKVLEYYKKNNKKEIENAN